MGDVWYLRVILTLLTCNCYLTSARLEWQDHASQLGADRWVIDKVAFAQRFYVDAGANHGVEISNTYLLDKMGWRGICIEPVELGGYEERTCTVVRAVLSGAAGETVEFTVGREHTGLSGITKHLGLHRETVKSESRLKRFNTTTLESVLDEHAAPSFIDYMSLDTEGSEYDILHSIDFMKYRFGHITVEHNGEEPKRANIHTFLTAHGYCRETVKDFDDWYILGQC